MQNEADKNGFDLLIHDSRFAGQIVRAKLANQHQRVSDSWLRVRRIQSGTFRALADLDRHVEVRRSGRIDRVWYCGARQMKKQQRDDEQHEVTLDDVIGYTRQIKGFAKLTDEQILVLIRHFAFMHMVSNQFRLQSERAAINVPPPKFISS